MTVLSWPPFVLTLFILLIQIDRKLKKVINVFSKARMLAYVT